MMTGSLDLSERKPVGIAKDSEIKEVSAGHEEC